MTQNHDIQLRFLLPTAGVRGVAVRLDDTWQAIVECALGAGIERSAVPAVR